MLVRARYLPYNLRRWREVNAKKPRFIGEEDEHTNASTNYSLYDAKNRVRRPESASAEGSSFELRFLFGLHSLAVVCLLFCSVLLSSLPITSNGVIRVRVAA